MTQVGYVRFGHNNKMAGVIQALLQPPPPDFRRNKIYSSEICLYKIKNIFHLYLSRLEAYKVT